MYKIQKMVIIFSFLFYKLSHQALLYQAHLLTTCTKSYLKRIWSKFITRQLPVLHVKIDI